MAVEFESFCPGQKIENVFQGQCKVSAAPEVVFSTVLGSCIAACVYDPIARVGGMNHFLLPTSQDSSSDPMRYGAHSMEVLLNSVFKLGARRDNLLVKIAGGAQITSNATDIGSKNSAFIHNFLKAEGYRIVSESIGGASARRVLFQPTTGEAKIRVVSIGSVEEDVRPQEPRRPATSNISLF